MTKATKEFSVRWSISRAADTYGYNICTIAGEGVKGRCVGGGYDMLGTSLAQVMQQVYPAYFDGTVTYSKKVIAAQYGLYCKPGGGYYFSGACGVECVERFLREVVGVDVVWGYSRNRKGQLDKRIGVRFVPKEQG